MSVNVSTNGRLERCIAFHSTAKAETKVRAPSVEFIPPRVRLSRAIGNILRSVVRYVEAFRAAQIVTHQAERYYAMSDSQLASIGLTRENVPTELRHALERNQLD
jgi:hypothetical protein